MTAGSQAGTLAGTGGGSSAMTRCSTAVAVGASNGSLPLHM
jgi:hypothetical protein